MGTTTPERISPIRSLEELLGLVPHLIGFHPEESLVLMALQGGRLRLTARVDLAGLPTAAHVADFVERVIDRFPGSAGLLVAYSASPRAAWRVLDAGVSVLGSSLLEALLVDGENWWLSAEELGGPYRPRGTVSAAEATVQGMVARACRAELVASLDGGPEERQALMFALPAAQRLVDAWSVTQRCDRMLGLLDEAVTLPATSGADLALLAVLAAEAVPRRAAVLHTSADNAAGLQRVWTAVVRGTEEPWRAGALGLLGLAAWVDGDGALQNVCAERAKELCPGLELATLLDVLNEAMVAPEEWPLLRRALAAEESELGADERADGVGQPHGEAADDHVARHRPEG